MSRNAASPEGRIHFLLSFSVSEIFCQNFVYLLICSRTQMQPATVTFSASARCRRRTLSVRKTASVYPPCRTTCFRATSSGSNRATVSPRKIFVLYESALRPEIFLWSDRPRIAVCSPDMLSLSRTRRRGNLRAVGVGLNKWSPLFSDAECSRIAVDDAVERTCLTFPCYSLSNRCLREISTTACGCLMQSDNQGYAITGLDPLPSVALYKGNHSFALSILL